MELLRIFDVPRQLGARLNGVREMDSAAFSAHVSRLVRLEGLFGASTKYELLDPFTARPSDVIDIQRAARIIRDFLGLHSVSFNIGTFAHADGVAGHIDLTPEDGMIYIEIAQDTRASEHRLLAVLAHEITHHFLNTHGVPTMDHSRFGGDAAHEYEVFTDTAAVFLGLGKLVLNGRETTDADVRANGGIAEVKYRVGYLEIEELALVYHIVCSMRRIPRSDAERALRPRALAALREVRSIYDSLAGLVEGEPDSRIDDAIAKRVEELQIVLSDLQSAVTFLRASVIRHMEKLCTEGHRQAAAAIDHARLSGFSDEVDPCLRYLRLLERQGALRQHSERLRLLINEASRVRDDTAILAQAVAERCSWFPQPPAEEYAQVPCGRCGTVLSLPTSEERRVVRCPNCGYQFPVRTTAPREDFVAPQKQKSILGLPD